MLIRPTIHLPQNTRNVKSKVYSEVFRATFFAFRISHQGLHSRKNSKNLVVYFFAALIKHEIRQKCEKCRVCVSHFMVCFAKTFAKCEIRKVYIAGLTDFPKHKNSIIYKSTISLQLPVSKINNTDPPLLSRYPQEQSGYSASLQYQENFLHNQTNSKKRTDFQDRQRNFLDTYTDSLHTRVGQTHATVMKRLLVRAYMYLKC